jgi:hypothetical protein
VGKVDIVDGGRGKKGEAERGGKVGRKLSLEKGTTLLLHFDNSAEGVSATLKQLTAKELEKRYNAVIEATE